MIKESLQLIRMSYRRGTTESINLDRMIEQIAVTVLNYL